MRTFLDSRIREIELDRCDWNAKEPVVIKLDTKEAFVNVTPTVAGK